MTDPAKDAERLDEIRKHVAQVAAIAGMEAERVQGHVTFLLRQIDRITQERDAVTRRAEALEAEVERLRREDEAARHDIERGLANLSSCEAEVGRLQALALDELAAESQKMGLYDTAAADHTERAREILVPFWEWHSSTGKIDLEKAVAAALTAAERAGAEKAVDAVRGCPCLDENGYICEKSAAIKAIRALAARDAALAGEKKP